MKMKSQDRLVVAKGWFEAARESHRVVTVGRPCMANTGFGDGEMVGGCWSEQGT